MMAIGYIVLFGATLTLKESIALMEQMVVWKLGSMCCLRMARRILWLCYWCYG